MTVALGGRLICATREEVARLRAHLPDHIRLTRAEPGCLAFHVAPTADPLVWEVSERFTDRAAFAAHQARTATSPWGAATTGIRRDYTIIGAG